MKLPRPIHRGLPRRIVPRSGDGGSSTRPFAKNLDRTSSHPHTSRPSPSRATPPQPTEPAQVGRVYPNHPAALRPGMRMGSNSPEQLNLHTTRDQVERMQVNARMVSIRERFCSHCTISSVSKLTFVLFVCFWLREKAVGTSDLRWYDGRSGAGSVYAVFGSDR